MNLRNQLSQFGFAAIVCSGMLACTQPGETTGIGAATGGVIGAGLGAVVGNQVGNPGKGLVVGAVAGSAAGALLGNSFQAQEETLRTQDEAIERQEHLIAAQRSQVEELRNLSQDRPAHNLQGRSGGYPNVPGVPVLKLKPPFSEQRRYSSAAHTPAGTTFGATPRMGASSGSVTTSPARDARGFFGRAAAPIEKDLALDIPSHGKPASLPERQVASRTLPGTSAIGSVAPAEMRIEPVLPPPSNEESVTGGAAIRETDLVVGHESAASKTFDELAGTQDEPAEIAKGAADAAISDAEDGDSFARGSLGWDDGVAGGAESSPAALNRVSGSAECVKAEEEVAKITGDTDTADKLFHYRRALRLCPENAMYHNGLGEVYLSLNRKSDAEFEFGEALRVDPLNREAQKNLNSLKSR